MNKNGDWEIKIRKVENGYILEWEDESESQENYFINNTKVFEIEENCDEDKLNELKTLENVLWEITNYFGVYYSKHDKYNLTISIDDKKTSKSQDES